MNNDDFKEVPDNIQDNKEETTNNIDNTNDNKSNDYEDVCYICRRPESVAGKMIHPAEPVHLQRLYAKDL